MALDSKEVMDALSPCLTRGWADLLLRMQRRLSDRVFMALSPVYRPVPYNHTYYWAAFIGSGNWRPLSSVSSHDRPGRIREGQ